MPFPGGGAPSDPLTKQRFVKYLLRTLNPCAPLLGLRREDSVPLWKQHLRQEHKHPPPYLRGLWVECSVQIASSNIQLRVCSLAGSCVSLYSLDTQGLKDHLPPSSALPHWSLYPPSSSTSPAPALITPDSRRPRPVTGWSLIVQPMWGVGLPLATQRSHSLSPRRRLRSPGKVVRTGSDRMVRCTRRRARPTAFSAVQMYVPASWPCGKREVQDGDCLCT